MSSVLPYTDKHCLIVDDDVTNRILLKQILKRYGLTASEAVDGQKALDALYEPNESGFDLVFMDMMMPILDGLGATQAIRKDEQFNHLPIIMLTANASTLDRQHCLDNGANDYLNKPINVKALEACLALHLA